MRSIIIGAGLAILLLDGSRALRAQNQPTLVLSPTANHSIDSLWLESYTVRKELSGCFKPLTYQIIRTPERTWALVIGPMTPSRQSLELSDSVEVDAKPNVELCDSLDVSVHTHILPPDLKITTKEGTSWTVRWEPSRNDLEYANSRPALFSILVAAPDSIFVYGGKPKTLWR